MSRSLQITRKISLLLVGLLTLCGAVLAQSSAAQDSPAPSAAKSTPRPLPPPADQELAAVLPQIAACVGPVPDSVDVEVKTAGTWNGLVKGEEIVKGQPWRITTTYKTLAGGMKDVEASVGGNTSAQTLVMLPSLSLIYQKFDTSFGVVKKVLQQMQCTSPLYPLQVGKNAAFTFIVHVENALLTPAATQEETRHFDFKVVRALDAAAATAAHPWLKLIGPDSTGWQVYELAATETIEYKWIKASPEQLAAPTPPYSRSYTALFLAGPNISIVDQSRSMDEYSVRVTELDATGAPLKAAAKPATPKPDAAQQAQGACTPGHPEPLTAAECANVEQVIKTGRPSQMYLLALDLEQKSQPALAQRVLHSVVTRFPDDPYATKAIDHLEAQRNKPAAVTPPVAVAETKAPESALPSEGKFVGAASEPDFSANNNTYINNSSKFALNLLGKEGNFTKAVLQIVSSGEDDYRDGGGPISVIHRVRTSDEIRMLLVPSDDDPNVFETQTCMDTIKYEKRATYPQLDNKEGAPFQGNEGTSDCTPMGLKFTVVDSSKIRFSMYLRIYEWSVHYKNVILTKTF